MKFKFYISVMFILLMSFSFASGFELSHSCDELVSELDNYDIEVPKVLGYSNERFAINIENETGFVIIENNKVVDAGCNVIENPTYTVIVNDWDTIEEIANSDDYIDKLSDSIGNGDIKIEAYSFTKKVKTFFGKIGLKIASWFN